MIVLDTNVISELWKVGPDQNVLAWIDAQPIETLYLSAVAVAELRLGLAAMPKSKRRTIYQTRLEQAVLPVFAGRVLPFYLKTSQAYADLMARAGTERKAIARADGCIAATAAKRSFTVATRDTSPFKAAALKTINPWWASP